MVIQDCIRALADGEMLSGEEAAAAMTEMMTGEATPAMIAAYLAALRIRGETAEVVAASAQVMQAHASQVEVEGAIDIVGTGGDGADTFNVSTAAAIVCAGAGAKVAKHGNRAMSSRCGSADVLEALGARTDLDAGRAAHVLGECGFCFLFAQAFHPAMRHVAGARREMGIRTVFNVLGPLTNPARPKRQLTGVGSKALGPLVAEALNLRGLERGIVVHSEDGMDEISPSGATLAWFIEGGTVSEGRLAPGDFGLPEHPVEAVAGGDAQENAAHLRAVLDGTEGPVTDFVLMTASAGLYVAGLADSFPRGVEQAREAIESGKARGVLERYVALSNEVEDG